MRTQTGTKSGDTEEAGLSVDRIIQHAQSQGSVARCLDGLADVLPAFRAAPAFTNRSFWTGLPANLRDLLIADGEKALEDSWPLLTAHAYRAFCETGNRVDYETAYFARRTKLNALVLAEAVEAAGRFTDAIVDGIYLLCEESGWQLPAHNSQARNTRQAPLPDPDRPVVDLFAAETGAQLAVIAQLLGDVLDAASPMILARIDREIAQRITTPYLNRHFWWMGNGDEPMNNWTAWCTQNVLLTTFCRPTDQKTRRAVIAKAAGSLDAFLKDYAEDGACEEGALYYRHAALCLFGALRVMDGVSPGAFAPLWRDTKIANMAEFIVHAHVANDHYINFADASAVLPPCGPREFLFGKAVGSEPLMALAASDTARNPRPDYPEDMNLSYRLLALEALAGIATFTTPPRPPADIYYPGCGVFIARDERFVLAAKAGDNDDGHNHNDVGNVILYKDGRPLLIDIGVETYTARTFSSRRYEIWTMQSGYHNLPAFEGVDQQAGAQFAATEVDVRLAAHSASIGMELAHAYPEEAGVRSYRRTVRLDKGGSVTITDIHHGSRAATLSLMLSEQPVVSAEGIAVGDLGTIRLSGALTPRVEEIEIADARLRQAWPGVLYRVLVPLAGNELVLEID